MGMKISKGWEYARHGTDHALYHPPTKCAFVLWNGLFSARVLFAVLNKGDIEDFRRYFNDRNIRKLKEILERY